MFLEMFLETFLFNEVVLYMKVKSQRYVIVKKLGKQWIDTTKIFLKFIIEKTILFQLISTLEIHQMMTLKI